LQVERVAILVGGFRRTLVELKPRLTPMPTPVPTPNAPVREQQQEQQDDADATGGTPTVDGGAGTEIMVDIKGVDGNAVDDATLELLANDITMLAMEEHGLLPDHVEARLW